MVRELYEMMVNNAESILYSVHRSLVLTLEFRSSTIPGLQRTVRGLH